MKPSKATRSLAATLRNALILWVATTPLAAEVRPLSLAVAEDSITTTGWSRLGPMTPDGRFQVLNSAASNLLAEQDDTNGAVDAFLHDRLLGTTTLLSHRPGEPLRTTLMSSYGLEISPDGRFVLLAEGSPLGPLALYDTTAATRSALPAGLEAWQGALWSAEGRELVLHQRVRNTTGIVFYDLTTGATRLVTHVAGAPERLADGFHRVSALTPDGRFLLFSSTATDLVPGQKNSPAVWNVFLFDRVNGQTELLSAAPSRPTVALGGEAAGLSNNGRWIAWIGSPAAAGFASDLPAQVLLFDRTLRQHRLVSRAAGSPLRPANGGAIAAHLSPNGRFVFFSSQATDLVPDQLDNPATTDVFLYDREAGTTQLVSHTAVDVQRTAAGDSTPLAISPDGRFATFSSSAADLVAGTTDTATSWDVFRFDRTLARTELVSHAVADPLRTGAGHYSEARVAAHGRVVIFTSASSHLVSGPDRNRADDVFVWTEGPVELLSSAAFAVRTTAARGGGSPRMTPDGRFVAFNASGSNLLPGGSFETGSYLYHRDSGQLEALPTGSVQAITPDAQRVLLTSPLTLPGGPPGFFQNAVVHDRVSGQTTIVSHAAGDPATSANGPSLAVALSDDGSFVLFSSVATNLVAGQVDTSGTDNLFLYDRQTATAKLVDHAATNPSQTGNGWTSLEKVVLTPDGRFVFFASGSNDLVVGSDLPNTGDAFLFDRTTGAVELVSHANGDLTTAVGGGAGEISADGRWLAFESDGPSFVRQISVLDRTTGQSRRITRDFNGGERPAAKSSYLVAMSPDGRYLLLDSEASLVDADRPWPGQVYLYDRVQDTFELISHRAETPQKGSLSLSFAIDLTPDGRFVLFEAFSDDVMGLEDTLWGPDFIRYDRTTRQARLISHRPGEPDGGSNAREPLFLLGRASLSDDGRTAAFVTQANNLYPHDFNSWITDPGSDRRAPDVFLFIEEAAPP